jgi:hypothetical protein
MPIGEVEVTVEFLPPLTLLVEAFVQGAGAESVADKEKEEEGKKSVQRKGDCHFLATVFSNLSMVRPSCARPRLRSRPNKSILLRSA